MDIQARGNDGETVFGTLYSRMESGGDIVWVLSVPHYRINIKAKTLYDLMTNILEHTPLSEIKPTGT